MDYRVITFCTFRGLVEYIDLGDSTYGEWIIYDKLVPKYHVSVFNKESDSDSLLRTLIEENGETIMTILHKINYHQRTKLSLGNKPFIRLTKKSAIVNLNLMPLPELWLKNIY